MTSVDVINMLRDTEGNVRPGPNPNAGRLARLEAEVADLKAEVQSAANGFALTGRLIMKIMGQMEMLRVVDNDLHAWAVKLLDHYNERHPNSPPALYPPNLPPGFAIDGPATDRANDKLAELVKENDDLRRQYEEAARARDEYKKERNEMQRQINRLEQELFEAKKPKPAPKKVAKKVAKKKS